ncbi:thermonuclease family protein [Hymenobacter caeli]|uniref:Endonuclease YncB(Thermonuclease family) n=1 Tax=Hymenobacter caeli TaxID=2735894 RepID=A0ABX2FUE0_9BACT|nr:thermonuclease family protein [Hymenobacter caeli]NRT20094.1 endonuclease YncB(thermonuclease family) [Hymenobacter caeli]
MVAAGALAVAAGLGLTPQGGLGPPVAGRALAGERPALLRAVVVEPAWEAARVVRVVDGDTYEVLTGGQLVRVRLLGVDAPEHDQAFGAQATDSVAALLRPGGVAPLVWLRRQGTDLYGRTLGRVRVPAGPGGPARALDSLLVVRGWAWAFDPNRAVAGRAAQQLAAQRAGRGLWKCGAAAAVPPKVWRGFTATIKRRYGVGCTW